MIAVTVVVTVLTGVVFLVLGMCKRGNLIRFVPYPVVGGFLAGAGWLLLKGGLDVASGILPSVATFGELKDGGAAALGTGVGVGGAPARRDAGS